MSIYDLDGQVPLCVDESVWVSPTAQLIGSVLLERQSSVWFNAVLRGDNELIHLGIGSNIQDLCMLHTDMGHPLMIGDHCTIGHSVILHGCTIGSGSLVGMGSIVMNGALIGSQSLIGAGSLIPEGKIFPDGVLIMGRPGKIVRELNQQEKENLAHSALSYQKNAMRYKSGLRFI